MIDIDASKMLKEANLRPTKQRVSLVANIYKYGNNHLHETMTIMQFMT